MTGAQGRAQPNNQLPRAVKARDAAREQRDVRHILLIGTQSLAGEKGTAFDHAPIELGVNATVAVALVLALVLVHKAVPPDVDHD